jgi:predicted anti-sigma-YlaC factor YlaD
MNAFDCESIRDQLPALMRGEMLPHEAASAELHLEGCAECRRDAEIIALLRRRVPRRRRVWSSASWLP